MKLKYILSLKDVNKLKRAKAKAQKNTNKEVANTYADTNNDTQHVKTRKKYSYYEDLDRRISKSKKYIRECPYCGNSELEITFNEYYYCTICGVKVEKR